MGWSTLGQPRALTDAQVQRIHDWHETCVRLRARRRELLLVKAQLAQELGVCVSTLDYVIRRGPDYRVPDPANRRAGAPPKIRDRAARARVLAWHAEDLAIRAEIARIPSFDEIASELHVSPSTILRIVIGPAYKQVSPERRAEEVARQRQYMARLRALNLA